MSVRQRNSSREAGFSLIELSIAMAVTLGILVVATNLLSQSFGVRSREDRQSDALADVQRALHIMAREISNSGFSIPSPLTYTPAGGGASATVPSNGLLLSYCDDEQLAFVSNLSAATASDQNVSGANEAVYYSLETEPATGNSYLVRVDLNNNNNTMVLANRIDAVEFIYVDKNPTTGALTELAAGSSPTANTVGVKIRVTVDLPAVGSPKSPGHQPAWQTELETQVVLRNAIISSY
ncbi:MAG TPA: prepilin-type N-terminal cleavage/methylation domain-containing protein [Pyrinomonadaceae bacterium]|jgi:prepilin-type N-terminal cleavage/methylation domain-containing protein